jgi:hypothetical protein
LTTRGLGWPKAGFDQGKRRTKERKRMETGDVAVSIRMGPSWRVQKPGVLFSDSKLLAPVEICMTIQELWNGSLMLVKNGCKLSSLGDRLKTLFWRLNA